VRLLLDAVGSARATRRFLAPLLAAGAEVQWFHPFLLRWIRKPRINLRNHRKLVVVDGRLAFAGGINITDDEDERLSEHAYHDLHLRLEGSVVRWLQVVFVEDWFYASNIALRDESLWPDIRTGRVPVAVLASGPDSPWESLHRVQVDAILRAEHRVWLVTPYFVPTEAARQALTSAALRGVDVRVIVPLRSDSLIVTFATRSYFDELVAAGVRVFEYQPRMLHSKALLVDDDTVLVGSANFDNRSFRLNFELSLLLIDAGLARDLAETLSHDLAHSGEVVAGRNPPLIARLAEAFARLLSPLL
jgi:cardiolipin synthase